LPGEEDRAQRQARVRVCAYHREQLEQRNIRHIAFEVPTVILVGSASASIIGAPEEAKVMILKARAAVNEMGRAKAITTFADPDGEFRDRDPCVCCIDMEGVLLSQPMKPELVGKRPVQFQKVR
jgi:hypothetical protein